MLKFGSTCLYLGGMIISEDLIGLTVIRLAVVHSCICFKLLLITLVSTQIFAEDISTVLRYIRCADSENGLIFAELASFRDRCIFYENIAYVEKQHCCPFMPVLSDAVSFNSLCLVP